VSGAWVSGTSCTASQTCAEGACFATTTATGASCEGASGAGLTTCPAGTGSESCCTSLVVPGGTYDRTYTYGNTSSYADPATVSGFRLDKYLVTVGRFRKFVAAWSGGYYPSSGSGIHTHLPGGGLNATGGGYETGWDATDWNNTTDIDPTTANLDCYSPYNTWTASVGSQENLPINCVNWYESYAFCIWDGGFLPSEAEWEYAAAGGSQQLEYPWGSTAPGTANQYAIYDDYYTGNATYIAPVGYAASGAGLWGQLDMAGELYEWNLDWYAAYVDPCTNCAYLSSASYRVVRGGYFGDTSSYLLPPYRAGDDFPPAYRGYAFGFRCARTP
jgi:formylglycine-generating enzyme required for sulfatase activity